MKTRLVTQSIRRRLKRPFGRVCRSSAAARALRGKPFVSSVGDISTSALLLAGVRPKVAVVDLKCRRRPVSASTEKTIASLRPAYTIRAKNKPGTVSAALQRAVRKAFSGGRFPVKILVDGEEDLAVIPAVLCAPEGSIVYYGQPGKGGVVIEVGAKTRRKFEKLFGGMG